MRHETVHPGGTDSRFLRSAVPFGFAQGPAQGGMDKIFGTEARSKNKGKTKVKVKGSGQECPLHTDSRRDGGATSTIAILDGGRLESLFSPPVPVRTLE